MGGITNETVHLSFDVDWSKEVNPLLTLGFSNINVSVVNDLPNTWGMLVVSMNLIVGYFMLAVLVTRLGILFQSLGPGYVAKKKKAVKPK